MNEEGFAAVRLLDVFVRYTRLEVQNVVCVGAEGGEDALNLAVLETSVLELRLSVR